MEKANVVKSKSSNSAITSKSDNRSNKKSRSNAEFQRNVVKKRGVYVEKKATNISIHDAENLPTALKAPRRPKPNQKRFLASVLTILSKSTAATQFPEPGTASTKKAKSKKTDSKNPKIDNKRKYTSKVLNDEMIQNHDRKSLVLQYKNIHNTTNYSDTDSFKNRDHSTKSVRSNAMKSDMVSVMSSEAKGVMKQVLEGLQEKKDPGMQDPVTQVEKINKAKETGENDEQLYKFFVDLLETTFSVYNVKAEYDKAPNLESTFSSKVAFEIDESVVKKLETRNTFHDDETQKQSHYYSVKDTDVFGLNAVPEVRKNTREIIEEPRQPTRPKRRMKTQSFIYNMKQKKSFDANLEPMRLPKKRLSKKDKKKTLLNLFKEQLKLSYSEYEEPQTLYQALRVIAKNKRKCERVRFDEPQTKECVFRRPKVISTRKPKRNAKYDHEYENNPYDNMRTSKSLLKTDALKVAEKDSYRTLEVYGFDYENDNNPAYSAGNETQQQFTSDDEFDFDDFNSYVNGKESFDVNDQDRTG
ncbi:uncharacterized protein LOC106141063 [Amyelois transitella]|uniref:uncharacterized protein LOC106141063 n=1 Tax=Amyelois transitella TaxID=680683 RepID=UPI00298FEB6E|nr:uncharacterized protein LOC106141063 [Amyelois transitella]